MRRASALGTDKIYDIACGAFSRRHPEVYDGIHAACASQTCARQDGSGMRTPRARHAACASHGRDSRTHALPASERASTSRAITYVPALVRRVLRTVPNPGHLSQGASPLSAGAQLSRLLHQRRARAVARPQGRQLPLRLLPTRRGRRHELPAPVRPAMGRAVQVPRPGPRASLGLPQNPPQKTLPSRIPFHSFHFCFGCHDLRHGAIFRFRWTLSADFVAHLDTWTLSADFVGHFGHSDTFG